MNFYSTRCWAEINLDNLLFNYQQIKKKIPDLKVMCVLKADGFGQGALYLAKTLEAALADYFAVATPEEALQLRRGNISTPILLLGTVFPEWIPIMNDSHITVTIGDVDIARKYAKMLKGKNTLKVHICINTGMNRIGLNADDAVEQIREIASYSTLNLEGIWTHFPSADVPSETEFTRSQISLFLDIVRQLAEYGIEIPLCHFANSDAVACFPSQWFHGSNMVRTGILLHGVLDYSAQNIEQKPVMALRARISKLRVVKKGESVSYGRRWFADRDSLIAVIGTGYGDGLSRLLSNKISVLVRGQKAPQVGRITMDQLMLDVTDIPDVSLGDIVTLVGTDGNETIHARTLSSLTGTGTAEFISNLGTRVPRRYFRNSHPVEEICYLDRL